MRVWKLHKLQISVMRRVSNTVWVGGDNNIHIVGAKVCVASLPLSAEARSPKLVLLQSGKTQTILGGHHGMILSMFVCDNTVWTSAEDNTIRVWNADVGVTRCFYSLSLSYLNSLPNLTAKIITVTTV